MAILTVLRSGHWPSLVGAWLHLTISFMVWLLIGAMSIALARDLQLSDQRNSLVGGASSARWCGAQNGGWLER